MKNQERNSVDPGDDASILKAPKCGLCFLTTLTTTIFWAYPFCKTKAEVVVSERETWTLWERALVANIAASF